MLILENKQMCCGCTACMVVCPKHCIEMEEDSEGFLYPQVDMNRCIDCKLCNQVCPMQNPEAKQIPLETYAVKNEDESVHKASSSGGFFTALAKMVLQEGGLVYGAAYDENGVVVHRAVETIESLSCLRGSKYVQSKMGTCLAEVKQHLENGRKVLFSGTPCQVYGLRRYLRRDYENLLMVDLVCHSVPSPRIWRDYLRYLNPKGLELDFINMRDKSTGWRKSTFLVKAKGGQVLLKERGSHNLYLRGFKSRNYTRPSCFSCPAKGGRSGSDLTLGDFWGVRHALPQAADRNGVGLLLVRTVKGKNAFQSSVCKAYVADYLKALQYNPCIEQCVSPSITHDDFWKRYEQEGIPCIVDFVQKKSIDRLNRIQRHLMDFLRKCFSCFKSKKY